MINKLILILVLCLSFSGCGNPNSKRIVEEKHKFYFTANLWPGKTFKTNRGSCVYDGKKTSKLYRYQVLTRVTEDGKKLIAFTPDHGKEVELVDLETKEMKKYKFDTYPTRFRWFKDKRRVLYSGGDPGTGWDISENIYIFDTKTGKHEKITHHKTDEDGRHSMFDIDLSPDEKKVVFSGYKEKRDYTARVRILDLETGGEEALPLSATAVAWAKDNTIIIYGIYNDYKGTVEGGSRFILYDPVAKKITKFPRDKSISLLRSITSSPDGKRVAYIKNENNGSLTVRSMKNDGTDHRLEWVPKYYLRDLNWTR